MTPAYTLLLRPFGLAAHAEHLCRRKAKQLGNAANLVILALPSGRRCKERTTPEFRASLRQGACEERQAKVQLCTDAAQAPWVSARAGQKGRLWLQLQLGGHKSMALEYGRPKSTSGDLETKQGSSA